MIDQEIQIQPEVDLEQQFREIKPKMKLEIGMASQMHIGAAQVRELTTENGLAEQIQLTTLRKSPELTTDVGIASQIQLGERKLGGHKLSIATDAGINSQTQLAGRNFGVPKLSTDVGVASHI